MLMAGAVLDVRGGAGGDGGVKVADEIKPEVGRRNSGSGGGGGGGRIALYSKEDLGAVGDDQVETTACAGVSLAGGKGGSMAKDGEAGTLYDGAWPGLR
jgi:hypothetical protein